MPSKTDRQHRFMEAVKHNPKFAKRVGVPQSVGADFVAADKRAGRYATGGYIGSLFGRSVPGRMQLGPVPGGRPTPLPVRSNEVPGLLRKVDTGMVGTGNRLGALAMRAKGGKISTLKTLAERIQRAVSEYQDHLSNGVVRRENLFDSVVNDRNLDDDEKRGVLKHFGEK